MTQKKKHTLFSWFKASNNANRNAKREQLKTLVVIIAVVIFGVGFYWYTSQPRVHKKKVVEHFAGAFSDNVGLEYDHTRIQSLLNQIDHTNSKLNDLEVKDDKAAHDKHEKQLRNQHQSVQEQQQIEALQQSVAQLKTALAAQVQQNKHTTVPKKSNHATNDLHDSVAIFAKDFRPSLPPKIGKNDATANCFCRGRPRHQHFARYACYVLALRWLYGCIKICRASLRAVLQIAAYHGLPNFASLSCWVAGE